MDNKESNPAGGNGGVRKKSSTEVDAVLPTPNQAEKPPADLTPIEIAAIIEAVKAEYPTLTAAGNGTYLGDGTWRLQLAGPKFDAARAEFTTAGVATAIAFLRQCRPVKKPNAGSYGLKHSAERWGGANGMQPYVKNGELILAAIHLGFPIKIISDNPNVGIGISRKDLRRLARRWS